MHPKFLLSSLLVGTTTFFTNSALAFSPESYLPGAHIGVYAVDLNTNKVVLAHNADNFFQPASTQKILTATTAILALGHDWSFKTAAYTNGSISGGQLNGDLVVVFDGDPSLKHDSLARLAQKISERGIKRITGDVYINVGKYNGHDYPQGWNFSNLGSCFSSPNSVAQVDYNCFAGVLKPNGSHTVWPSNPYYNLTNSVTVSQDPNCELNFVRTGATSATLTGCTSLTRAGKWMNIAVVDGNDFTRNHLRGALLEQGIHWKNNSKNIIFLKAHFPQTNFSRTLRQANASASVAYNGKSYNEIASIRSAPVDDLIREMLKESENHIAEQLFRASAYAINNHRPVNYTSAIKLNRNLIQSSGLNTNYKVYDGSGLSYYNLITPRALTEILVQVAVKQNNRYNLANLLPNGTQGTLALHKTFKQLGSRLIGKTGSVANASNFSGILTADNGHRIAFTSFVINNASGFSSGKLDNYERALINALGARVK